MLILELEFEYERLTINTLGKDLSGSHIVYLGFSAFENYFERESLRD